MKKYRVVVFTVGGLLLNTPIVWAGTKTPPLPESSSSAPLVGMFVTMLVVIGLAWVVIRLFLKKFNIKTKGNIDVMAVRQVTPNRFVGVVDVYGKKYVVGIGETVTCLDRLSDEDIPPEALEPTLGMNQSVLNFTTSLKDTLHKLREQYGRPHGGKEND